MVFGNGSKNAREPLANKPRWFKTWTWTAASFGIAGSVGFLLLTELRSGPLVAALAGLGVYYLTAFALPDRLSRRRGQNDATIQNQSTCDDPRVELLVEAHQHLETLAQARLQVPAAMIATLDRLHDHTHAIIDAVKAQPEKLNAVLRFFTYYLPSTADLVADRTKLASHAGAQRLAEIDHTLVRLIEAFCGFENIVRAPDLESVDLDVELIDQALNADLESLKR